MYFFYSHLPLILQNHEQGMLDIAGEERACSLELFSSELIHMDSQVLADQQNLTSALSGHQMQSRGIARISG